MMHKSKKLSFYKSIRESNSLYIIFLYNYQYYYQILIQKLEHRNLEHLYLQLELLQLNLFT